MKEQEIIFGKVFSERRLKASWLEETGPPKFKDSDDIYFKPAFFKGGFLIEVVVGEERLKMLKCGLLTIEYSPVAPARHRKPLRRCGQAMVEMFYFTYVLKSKKDRKLYVGWTSNLRRRLNKHSRGEVEATKHRKPFTLVYYEACLNKEKAVKREKYFKTGFGRRFLKNRL